MLSPNGGVSVCLLGGGGGVWGSGWDDLGVYLAFGKFLRGMIFN